MGNGRRGDKVEAQRDSIKFKGKMAGRSQMLVVHCECSVRKCDELASCLASRNMNQGKSGAVT